MFPVTAVTATHLSQYLPHSFPPSLSFSPARSRETYVHACLSPVGIFGSLFFHSLLTEQKFPAHSHKVLEQNQSKGYKLLQTF